MPFELIRNDSSRVKAGAIVNSANPDPVVGRGTDMAVFTAAGYDELLAGVLEHQKENERKNGNETASH